MKRYLAPFQRLQWKLTRSYIVVTVGTLFVIELLVSGVLLLLLTSNHFTHLIQESIHTHLAGQARPYLEQRPPDRVRLQIWANSLIRTSNTFNFRGGLEEKTAVSLGRLTITLDEHVSLYIMDPALRILAQVPEPAEPLDADHLFDPVTILGSNLLLHNALANVQDRTSLYRRHPNGVIVMAEPIVSNNGEVIGLILLTYASPILEPTTFSPLLRPILLTLIPLTVITALIGAIFGSLTARGFVKRLQKTSQTVQAWSQGDFLEMIEVDGGDELGQLNHHLNEMAQKLQTLIQIQHQLAIVKERHRLARELHDTVKQNTFATIMQLGAAHTLIDVDTTTAKTHLEEAKQLMRQSQQEVTELIDELYPTSLSEKGLVETLRDYVTMWSRRTAVHSDFKVQGVSFLSSSIDKTLLRVTQEALANIERHSQADLVDIQLDWHDRVVTLIIQDNGKGFDMKTPTRVGRGLRNMDERLAQLKGELKIESKWGNGTTLIATIPRRSEDTYEA